MKKKLINNDIIEFLIGISFVMSVYGNILSYYLTGNQNDLVRTIISWGAIFGIAAILMGYVIQKWFLADIVTKKKIFIYLSPLILNGIMLISGLVSSGGNYNIFIECVSFGAYCVPVVCGAVYMILERRFDSVIFKLKYVMLTMLPYYCLALTYFWELTTTSGVDGFGGLVYLSIGYSVIPIYAALIYDLIMLFKKNEKVKMALVIFEMVICSLIAIATGARGVLLAWIVINLAAIMIVILKKETKILFGVAISVVSVLLFCILAPTDNMAIGRQFNFINELKQGKLTESLSSQEGQQLLNDLFEQANGEQGLLEIAQGIRDGVNDESRPMEPEATPEVLNPTEPEVTPEVQKPTGSQGSEGDSNNFQVEDGNAGQLDENYKDAVFSITNGSMARSYLWQLAIKEMQEDPIFGMGAMGYQQKYSSYTHNILLECLADFGIIVFFIFFMICALSFIVLVKKAIKEWKYCGILLLISGEIIHAMLSGDLYVCPFLLFTFVMAIEIIVNHKDRHSEVG